jgi:hypothetical protein
MIDRSILSDEVIARTIRGQVVFMSKAHNDVLTLNETASFIVENLPSATNLGDFSARVMREFKIDDAAQVQRDIRSLLASLREKGIVKAEAVARFLDE